MGVNAGCFETKCDFAKGTYQILNRDQFFPFSFECKFKNQEHLLVNHNMTLYCSDPRDICKQKFECPENCNGRGTCLENNTCFCDFFYEGQLCGSFKQCPGEIMSICNQLKTKNLISELDQTNDYATALNLFTQGLADADKMILDSSASNSNTIAPSNDSTTVLSGTSLSTNINNETSTTDSANTSTNSASTNTNSDTTSSNSTTDSTNSTVTTTNGDGPGQTQSTDITQTGNHTEHTMDKGNSAVRRGLQVFVGGLALLLALA